MHSLSDHFDPLILATTFDESIKRKRSMGVDKITVDKFQDSLQFHIDSIHHKCLLGNYKFTPYLQQLKAKGAHKEPRIISVPTVRDRLTLKALTNYLHHNFEDCVARNLPNTVIKNIKDDLKRSQNDELVYIKLDFRKFYDNIPHSLLISVIKERITDPKAIKLIYKAIQNCTLEVNYSKEQRNKKNLKGVPQGLSISNILAEIYLKEFDASIKTLSKHYCRFVDDVFILCNKNMVSSIWKEIDRIIEIKELDLNTEKSTNNGSSQEIKHGFDFLGYSIQAYDQVTVRQSSLLNYKQSIIDLIIGYKNSCHKGDYEKKVIRAQAFIDSLNEKITGAISDKRRYGWNFFFSQITDIDTLKKIDRLIQQILKRIQCPVLEELTTTKFEIKNVVKSHYEAKYSPEKGYIKNYNDYNTLTKRRDHLIAVGVIDKSAVFTEKEINKIFDGHVQRKLSKLLADTARIS